MFGWFRKKEIVRPTPEVDRLLALSDTDFADVCARIIHNEDEAPGANAMVVVAYANMEILLPLIIYALEKKNRKTNAPPSDNSAKATMQAAEIRTRLAGMTQKDRMACITKPIEEGDEAIVAVLDEIHAFEGMAHHYDDVFRLSFEKLTSPTETK